MLFLSIATESCFNVQTSEVINAEQTLRLVCLLAETFESQKLRLENSIFQASGDTGKDFITMDLEYEPRMTFASTFPSNSVSICQACGLSTVDRLEGSRRFRFTLSKALSPRALSDIHDILHDRITEEEYKEPIATFDIHVLTARLPMFHHGGGKSCT